MENRTNTVFAPRFMVGLGIITLGVVFLLGNLDIINVHEYLRFWPAILIFIGIAYLLQCRRGAGLMWGIFLIFVGTGMLLDNLGIFYFNLWHYWPLLLVFAGIMMIIKASTHKNYHHFNSSESSDSNSVIKAMAVMGGFRLTNNSKDFRGGDLTAIMGGLEVDLRDASIADTAIIDIFTLMGGVEMHVPEDWLVIIDGFPFMGGFENKTRTPKEGAKRLIIKGTAIMGGLEVKN